MRDWQLEAVHPLIYANRALAGNTSELVGSIEPVPGGKTLPDELIPSEKAIIARLPNLWLQTLRNSLLCHVSYTNLPRIRAHIARQLREDVFTREELINRYVLATAAKIRQPLERKEDVNSLSLLQDGFYIADIKPENKPCFSRMRDYGGRPVREKDFEPTKTLALGILPVIFIGNVVFYSGFKVFEDHYWHYVAEPRGQLWVAQIWPHFKNGKYPKGITGRKYIITREI